MGHAVFVFGAAGSGKTTFCRNLRELSKKNRRIKLINLDPAQENGADYDFDLCDYITVNEVMEECDYGPNGALFYALNEMAENIEELHLEQFEDEYFFFDCPGQIELFLHSDVLIECAKKVKNFAKIVIVYLIDSSNFMNTSKLLYSMLCQTISVYRFSLPLITIASKADLLDEEKLSKILDGEDLFEEDFGDSQNGKMCSAMAEYVNNNAMQTFLPLDWKNDDHVENVFITLDHLLQRYDDEEPNENNNEIDNE